MPLAKKGITVQELGQLLDARLTDLWKTFEYEQGGIQTEIRIYRQKGEIRAYFGNDISINRHVLTMPYIKEGNQLKINKILIVEINRYVYSEFADLEGLIILDDEINTILNYSEDTEVTFKASLDDVMKSEVFSLREIGITKNQLNIWTDDEFETFINKSHEKWVENLLKSDWKIEMRCVD